MPDGVAHLRDLGVDPASAGGRPFRGIRYIDGDLTAEARFRGSPGVGIRRTALQSLLVEEARRTGVRLDFGVTVRGLARHGVQTDLGVQEADFVVGADGLNSRIRRLSGLELGSRGSRFGVRRHYRVRPWSDLVEVHWADRCEAYVTPVGNREVGVALLWDGSKGRFDDLLERFPLVSKRLERAEVLSKDRGAGPLERRVRTVVANRLALVGDAAGYLDAITGEGLTAGFAQAKALAYALESGNLAGYARRHRHIQRVPCLLIRALLAAEKRPRLRRRMIRELSREPALFARLVEVHTGERRISRIGFNALFRMGRLLLAS